MRQIVGKYSRNPFAAQPCRFDRAQVLPEGLTTEQTKSMSGAFDAWRVNAE